ncbi:MAG: hypothetical protein HQM10_18195 [Candidatus Riflebacteria bacterium]|nr:hypothetical protein [Candidatus Riflebacteria bacterium]
MKMYQSDIPVINNSTVNQVKEKMLDLLVLLKAKASVFKHSENPQTRIYEYESLITEILVYTKFFEELYNALANKNSELETFPALHEQLSELKNLNSKLEKSFLEELSKNSRLNETVKTHLTTIDQLSLQLNTCKRQIQELSEKKILLEEDIKKKENLLAVSEMDGFQRAASKLQPKLAEIQNELISVRGLNEKLAADKRILEEKEKVSEMQCRFLEEKLKNSSGKMESLKAELLAEINRPPRGLPEDKNKIRELETTIDTMRREMVSSNFGEIEQNIIVAYKAKFENQEREKNLLIEKLKLYESDTTSSKKPVENNKLAEENKTLKLTLNNLLEKIKGNIQETSECTYSFTENDLSTIFKYFSGIQNYIPNFPEIKEIQKYSSEIFQLYIEKGLFKKIPSTGNTFDERFHKAIKCFFSGKEFDKIIVKEISPGFMQGDSVLKKTVVWVCQNVLVCSECKKEASSEAFKCSGCGRELLAYDGKTTRRNMSLIYEENEEILAVIKNLRSAESKDNK